MRFQDCKNSKELKQELLKVLSNTGKNGLDNSMLYHYTSATVVHNIVSTGYIWLGRTDKMNDRMEGEYIEAESDGTDLHFTSFSRVEENLAMYKMYSPAPDGVMMGISYKLGKNIINSLNTLENGKKELFIVRNNEVTNEIVEGSVYWAEVCYKDLHTDEVSAGDKHNSNIQSPLNDHNLAGFVKLYGWSYEREVRLCVSTNKKLEENERIAIKISKEILKKIKIVTCPEFDSKKNSNIISWLKRNSYNVLQSNYEGIVDLGYDLSQNAYVAKLEKENQKLKKENEKLKKCVFETDKELFKCIVDRISRLKYILTEYDLGAGITDDLLLEFEKILEERKDPLKGFTDDDIEKRRIDILDAIDNFMTYASLNMVFREKSFVPIGEEESWKSPEAHELYMDRVDNINRLSAEIWDKYMIFVKEYKKKSIGIVDK